MNITRFALIESQVRFGTQSGFQKQKREKKEKNFMPICTFYVFQLKIDTLENYL